MADRTVATAPDLERRLEEHRGELTGYCYRMLGSPFEAEDAVQETLIRAWDKADRFEGRASLRTWLYRIATNVCIDMLRGRGRRARPMDLGPASSSETALGPPLTETAWVEPIPDGRLRGPGDDPADVVVERDTVRLAFVAMLQTLPPRQRAVLILREVLRWRAAEVAELLETSVAAVNSALQRARSTMDAADVAPDVPADPLLLERYVEAFERYDIDALVSLIHEDADFSMPPYELWLRGHRDIRGWYLGPGQGCRGSRLIPVGANGSPAFGQYRASGPGGRHEPWALHVLEVSGDRIVELNHFLDTDRLFPLFGLQPRLEGSPTEDR